MYLVCEEASYLNLVVDGCVPGNRRLYCVHDVDVLESWPNMITATGYLEFEDSHRGGRLDGVAAGVIVKRVPFV